MGDVSIWGASRGHAFQGCIQGEVDPEVGYLHLGCIQRDESIWVSFRVVHPGDASHGINLGISSWEYFKGYIQGVHRGGASIGVASKDINEKSRHHFTIQCNRVQAHLHVPHITLLL